VFEISGFEETQAIGTELSEEGSKLLPQFDFAFVHDIPHTKRDWIHQKLEDPRVFDENRILQPLEKLRMPDFGFSEEEARLLTTAVMSFQRDVQPKQSHVPRSARKDAIVDGRNLIRRRNCVGCHEMEGDGGGYRELVEEPSLAPPLLTPEGAKVQPDWLYAFFRGPITIRPWLHLRAFRRQQRWRERRLFYQFTIAPTVPFHLVATDTIPAPNEIAAINDCILTGRPGDM
jgi:hypothetical protein